MDHGGQFESEGQVMSQVQVGIVDFCDNQPSLEAFTAQTQNLNETNTLAQTRSPSLLQKEDGGGRGLIQKASLSSNEKDMEREQEKKRCTVGNGEDDEEKDMDEEMKEEEEEDEMSEGSSSLIRCQFPDTVTSDSFYSEKGSLLETPYLFSPGTSPVPAYPVLPMVCPETAFPISQMVLSQRDAQSHTLNTELVASKPGSVILGPTLTMGLLDSPTQVMISDASLPSPPRPTCINEAKESLARNKNSTTEHFTSSIDPILCHGLAYARGFSSSLCTSIDSTALNATTGALTFTGPTASSTESISAAGPTTLNCEQITSTQVPTCVSASTCAPGPIPSHFLLDALQQLAQRGDDTHLPQHLHQIAEAFFLQEDYQRALCCIQLERLYHQRILDNLNALQEQWESQHRWTSTDLATQDMHILKHICQSHNRPRVKDAMCASLDVLRPTLEEGGALAPCISAPQVNREMEQSAEDNSHSLSSHPATPSINLAASLNSPETSGMDREIPDGDLDGRDSSDGTQLTERHSIDREGVRAEERTEYTNSVIRNELHPSKAGEMVQSKPAEQQRGELHLAHEKEANGAEEERKDEEIHVVKMEDEGDDEEEEKPRDVDSLFFQKAFAVETLVSGAEVELEQLHQEALSEEVPHEETQGSAKTCLHNEALLPQEAQKRRPEWREEEEEEEQEDDYEVEQADVIREAVLLDTVAKLITVEEMPSGDGLVSILKKHSVCSDNLGVSASSGPRSVTPSTKRRVRFSVPADNYEHDVGSGDSCLLLFLLCLVTVVISVGGTALYCAVGDSHSSVCQDFSRNADFYVSQIQRGISHIQLWFAPGS